MTDVNTADAPLDETTPGADETPDDETLDDEAEEEDTADEPTED